MATITGWTAQEIAARAGVSSKRVHQWMQAHGRQGQHVLRRVLYTEADAADFYGRSRKAGWPLGRPRKKPLDTNPAIA